MASSKKNKSIEALSAARAKAFEARQQMQAARVERRKQDNKIAIVASIVAIAIAVGTQVIYSTIGPGSPQAEPSSSPSASEELKVADKSVAEGARWNGEMSFNGSSVEIELFGDLAPQAVANFLTLAKGNYYRPTTCPRLVTGGIKILQCGESELSGGPGFSFGPVENAPENDQYKAGYLAMARVGGDGNSMGSQFFIVYEDSMIPSDAAGGYTVFGQITSGLDAFKQLASAGTADGKSDGKPKENVQLTILRNFTKK